MAAKLSTKPNSKRQFSAPKRTWSVLTATDPKHVKKLEHIQETLDAAIETIQEEGGIEDWEDFKNFVESFNKRPDRINESGNHKASVSMDLVTEGKGGEVSGFVFYLTKDPSQRTSGVYLVKNLKQADVETKDNNNYYTPSQIMDLIGLDASDELEEDSISEEFDEELDDELEDDLSDLEEDADIPSQNTQTRKSSQSKRQLGKSVASKNATSRTQKKEEEDNIEELLSDDEDAPIPNGVLGKIAKNRSVLNQNDNGQIKQKVAEQPEAKYPLLDTLETVLKETERQGASVASMGSEINGLTVSGLTVQTASLMGLLGAKSIGELIDYIEQAREKEQAEKLEKILEKIDSLNDRADRVATRAKQADVIAGIEAIDTRTEKLAERAKQVLEPPAATEPEELETSQPQRSDRDIEAKLTEKVKINNPETKAAQIGERIGDLESKLNPNSQKSRPLQLDKDTSISEQLDQIQDYLGNLSKRLDRLESIVDKLEHKMTVQMPVESEFNPNSQVPETRQKVQPAVTAPNSIDKEEGEPEDLLSKMVTQTKVQQQREAVADCLVNYAFATGQSPQSGIAFDGGGRLNVTAENNEVKVVVKGSDHTEIFSGTKNGERWKFEPDRDKLTPEEREAIFKLPQSEEEYNKLATAQALVEKFQDTFPKRFSGEKDPVFPWKESRREDGTTGAVKYEFEILDLPDGSKQLIGTDPRQGDAQVFDAVLVKGKPPDVRQCHIAVEEMEAVVGSPEPQKTQSRDSHASKDYNYTSPERKEQSQEDSNELQA
ncbi:hypothetical protein [Microcoleus sp. PH2017_28_MFU_U_A]|uniref:hypothetical protein n=1 Tax=Microcoleus sp. PH2017_28_MFU_U_A TaxID=2798838 RepID=UPI001D7FC445|nr:hypothetical protein [Microcoleus sp. PH2017_28_MFU_U_A]MCC3589247.1 hypothetical protein [Microcoleus sp. PH2017_28_MFU_U_A]